MSIDARIVGVRITDKACCLILEPRDKRTLAGQPIFEIVNPPPDYKTLEVLIGECVWGGAGELMIGEIKIATRIGYSKIELISIDFLKKK